MNRLHFFSFSRFVCSPLLSLRQQTVCKIPASPYAVQNHIAGNGSIVMNGGSGVAPTATPTKHSMLDKLKLFNKEKPDRSSKTQISKRTSSSSGFSSARSERSDSSLSLNNDQTTKTSGIPVSQPVSAPQQPSKDAKKSDNSTASKTKSKLLLSSSSSKSSNKDTLTKSKSEKKDKSPARMSADLSESKIAVPKVQKSASSKNESKLKLISSSRKSLTEQSANKATGISQIPPPSSSSSMTSSTSSAIGKAQTSSATQQPQLVNQTSNAVTTSIPKPMAAIKGQTKLSNAHNQTNAQKTNEQYVEMKCQKLVDISSQNNNNNHNQHNGNSHHNNNNISTANPDDGQQRMQIIAPILIENAVVVNQQQQQPSHQVLANHIQMQQALNQQNISMSDSCHSKSTMNSSTTTSTTGPITNSCDSTNGIIYRQATSSDHSGASDVMLMRPGTILSPSNKLILANRARHHQHTAATATDRYGNHMHHDQQGAMIKASSNGSIASSASSAMTAVSSSNSSGTANGSGGGGGSKFHTVPTKQIQNGVIYEEEKQMTVVPMRPLLRGYNSHLTLPTRGNRNQNVTYSDYNDDMAQGYCSDGDALRKTTPVRYSDIENGYMSEGGGGCTPNATTNGNVLHHKPMLLRARTQLPTTMEER